MPSILALLFACGGEREQGVAPPEPAEDAGASVPAAAAPVATASTEPGPGLEHIRVGWQTAWATQGQLVAVLLHTDILARNGFVGDFRGYPYGAPLNDAARAGQVDAIFTADQPALALASQAPSWGIIGRLMYNRVGTVVPLASSIRAPRDLDGKTLAVPFGAAAQREALEALHADAVAPEQVTQIDRDATEILEMVRAGTREGRWREADAAALFDPAFAEVEQHAPVRTIASSVVTAVVMMDDAYVAAHPGADERLRNALAMAWDVYRADPRRADRWYLDLVDLPLDPNVLTAAAAVEPNLSARSTAEIRVHLTDADVASLREAHAFMVSTELLPASPAADAALRPLATRPLPPVGSSGVTVRP